MAPAEFAALGARFEQRGKMTERVHRRHEGASGAKSLRVPRFIRQLRRRCLRAQTGPATPPTDLARRPLDDRYAPRGHQGHWLGAGRRATRTWSVVRGEGAAARSDRRESRTFGAREDWIRRSTSCCRWSNRGSDRSTRCFRRPRCSPAPKGSSMESASGGAGSDLDNLFASRVATYIVERVPRRDPMAGEEVLPFCRSNDGGGA